MEWLAVQAQFIRKNPVNWVLAGLCWGSGTHGLGIQERRCDACQTFELWQAGVAGMGRAGQPSAAMSGRAPRRFGAAIVLARLIPLAGMLVWFSSPSQIVCHTSWALLRLKIHVWGLICAAAGHKDRAGPGIT